MDTDGYREAEHPHAGTALCCVSREAAPGCHPYGGKCLRHREVIGHLVDGSREP